VVLRIRHGDGIGRRLEPLASRLRSLRCWPQSRVLGCQYFHYTLCACRRCASGASIAEYILVVGLTCGALVLSFVRSADVAMPDVR
jgi:hypothetical protein